MEIMACLNREAFSPQRNFEGGLVGAELLPRGPVRPKVGVNRIVIFIALVSTQSRRPVGCNGVTRIPELIATISLQENVRLHAHGGEE